MSRRLLAAGLLGGCVWGFVEVAFAYLTGSSPLADVVETFLAPLIASLLYFGLVASSLEMRPSPFLRWLGPAGFAAPTLTYLFRGIGQWHPAPFAFAVAPLLLLIPLCVRAARSDEQPVLTPSCLLALHASYALSALAFLLRTDRVDSIAMSQAQSVIAVCVGVGVAAATLSASVLRSFVVMGCSVSLASCAVLVAVSCAARPPAFHGMRAPSRPAALATVSPPNVLLIVMDTVRADRLDLYGYDKPTFTKTSAFLREGLVFDRAVAAGTFSLSSHAALFTGRLPSTHGAHPTFSATAPYGRLWLDMETLATWLRSRGYATAGVSANSIFLGPWTGLTEGFDLSSTTGNRDRTFETLASFFRRTMMRLRLIARRTSNLTWDASEITDAALGLLEKPRKPFFLFLNYFDAHEPHEIPAPPPWKLGARIGPSEVYDTEVAYIDAHVARLLESLRDHGELDRTLVIVTADHGEFLGEHRLRGHPAEPYETSIHVPLAMRLPGIFEPDRTPRRTGLVEVFDIVRDVVEGRTVKRLREIDDAPRILSEAWNRADYGGLPSKDGKPSTTVVYAGDLKLIHRLSGRSQLFDLSTDPGEGVDLYSSTDPRIAALRDRMIREVNLRPYRPSGPPQELSEEAKERLRALGYLK